MGIDPADYRGLEPKLATALGAAPFVSVTGWRAPGDAPGSRHPQAFAACWSTGSIAAAPQNLSHASGSAEWVLAGRLNSAFDAARLARPELVIADCLTAPGSPGGIWEITLRLYGGVTLADVRAKAGRIRQTLDTPWLRVAPADAGCVLFAGVRPEVARLAHPGADRLRLVALDWDHAWSDSGVTGKAGLLPHLLVLIDEFTSLVGSDPVPPRTDDPELEAERDLIEAANHARIEIGVFAGKIAREAAPPASPSPSAPRKLSAKMLDTIPGAGDLKVNRSRVLPGKTSWGDRVCGR